MLEEQLDHMPVEGPIVTGRWVQTVVPGAVSLAPGLLRPAPSMSSKLLNARRHSLDENECHGAHRIHAILPKPAANGDPERDPRRRRLSGHAVGPDRLLRRSGLTDIRGLRRARRVDQLQHSGVPSLRPWLKVDIYNLFDNEKLIAWNTTVSQNKAAGVDNLGLATSYTQGATFGTATGNTQTNLNVNNINTYPLAANGATPGGRMFRAAVGFRF
jgi:hypothetical protein